MVHGVLSIIFLLLFPFSSLAQTTDYGPALTEAALKIQGAISPACNTSDSCVQFVTDVIPRCQMLRGDAGCWCGNHNPLHFCAICMSNPTDNRTSADQTAAALEGHQDYHVACNAFEAALNASLTASAGPSSTSSGTSTTSGTSNSGGGRAPTGAIIGGAVGGGIAIGIAILVLILWLRQRDKSRIVPSKISLFSAPGASTPAPPYSGYQHPQPVYGHHDGQYGQYGSSFAAPGYTSASIPYQPLGVHSPGPHEVSDGSYQMHPEPMTPTPALHQVQH